MFTNPLRFLESEWFQDPLSFKDTKCSENNMKAPNQTQCFIYVLEVKHTFIFFHLLCRSVAMQLCFGLASMLLHKIHPAEREICTAGERKDMDLFIQSCMHCPQLLACDARAKWSCNCRASCEVPPWQYVVEKKKKKYDQETITAGKTLHAVEKTSRAI